MKHCKHYSPSHAPEPIQLEKFELALLTWKFFASPEVFQMPTGRGRGLPPTSWSGSLVAITSVFECYCWALPSAGKRCP
jgi:hypothetical protein